MRPRPASANTTLTRRRIWAADRSFGIASASGSGAGSSSAAGFGIGPTASSAVPNFASAVACAFCPFDSVGGPVFTGVSRFTTGSPQLKQNADPSRDHRAARTANCFIYNSFRHHSTRPGAVRMASDKLLYAVAISFFVFGEYFAPPVSRARRSSTFV